jgi:hypothetical protein
LEVQVDANTVIAICSVVIAVASLGVSAYVAWATRKHNRLSVQPHLGFGTGFPVGGTAGLLLGNSGLGPARITSSQLTYNGEQFGQFDKPHVDEFRRRLAERDHLTVRPHATTLGGRPLLDTDYQAFLLSVHSYNPSEHDEFRRLIVGGRLRLEIQYESIYGDRFTAHYPERGLISSPPAEDRPSI